MLPCWSTAAGHCMRFSRSLATQILRSPSAMPIYPRSRYRMRPTVLLTSSTVRWAGRRRLPRATVAGPGVGRNCPTLAQAARLSDASARGMATPIRAACGAPQASLDHLRKEGRFILPIPAFPRVILPADNGIEWHSRYAYHSFLPTSQPSYLRPTGAEWNS